MNDAPDALVIGAGPAGLMAADALARAGRRVLVAEAKPSPARKFLMAGKSGLNLTNAAPPAEFIAKYGNAAPFLADIIAGFDADAVQDWARGLGQDVFVGSSGRVFPRAMKASPLLRAWLADLTARGMELRRNWRWTGWTGAAWTFATPEGPAQVVPRVVVLALGGASWARLGSDGAWAPLLAARGVAITPFAAANAGLRVDWSAHMARFFGMPLKSIALRAGGMDSRGECVISARGIEGGGIYPLAPALRTGAGLVIDLLPDRDIAQITARLARPRGKASTSTYLRKVLGLDAVKIALLREFTPDLPQGAALARRIKALPITHAGLRPLDEAISTAGGIALAELTPDLMIARMPGVFAAGEMLDWEAPTGGWLLNACLATGLAAGRGAAGY